MFRKFSGRIYRGILETIFTRILKNNLRGIFGDIFKIYFAGENSEGIIELFSSGVFDESLK